MAEEEEECFHQGTGGRGGEGRAGFESGDYLVLFRLSGFDYLDGGEREAATTSH